LVGLAVFAVSVSGASARQAPLTFRDSGELQKDIDSGKTVMFIFPHPDDEAWVAGTLAMVAADKGTFCYVCCLGSVANVRSENIDVPSRLQAIRWLTKAYLRDYIFLENNFTSITPKMLTAMKPRLIEAIEDKKPDIIITFSPAGYDGNINHRMASKLVGEAYYSLSYKPKLYYVINIDQELQMKAREYRKYPPTDIIDLDVFSEKMDKTIWDAKLEIWRRYSDSSPALMGITARTKRLENNDHKEYFMKVR
jgi:LmbE family N-acetylglucosaminyl deacetylase